MITGTLTYKETEFCFVFDYNELRLIPSKEKRREIFDHWIMKEISEGMYTVGDPLVMEEKYLVGRCNEDGKKIIFYTNYGADISSFNSVLIVDIKSYIVCRFDRDCIDKISFESPEIDYIYPPNSTLEYRFGEPNNDELFGLSLNRDSACISNKETFSVRGKTVSVSFGFSWTTSTAIERAPLIVNSCMDFVFEPTNDYAYVLELWSLAQRFIQYLCNRQNIEFSKTRLYSPCGNKHEFFAEMNAITDYIGQEEQTLKNGRYIKYDYIKGSIGKLLQSIEKKTLYMRHIPKTYDAGKHIDESSFVMITAAFEWEFQRLFPNGVAKKENRKKAEQIAVQTLEEMINDSSGEVKDIYKFLKKQIGFNSLEQKIVFTGKKLDSLITVFGNHLYQLNGEELKYSEMGKRIANQRNDFAHGNLDHEFQGLALLDLIYLKRIIYAMQLTNHGVSDSNIKNAINNLFRQGINLELTK